MAHAELVEQLAPGEGQHRGRIAAGAVADDAGQQDRVAVGVGPARARRGLQRRFLGEGRHVANAEHHVGGGIEGGGGAGGEGIADVEAAVHAQQVVDGDRVTRIARIGPGGDRRRPVERELALPHQDADQGVGHRLGGRPAHHLRVDAIARRIALGDHPAVVHDHHRLGVAIGRRGVLGEGPVEGLLQGRLAGFDHLAAGDVGQQGRCRRRRRQGDRRRRLAVQHQAAQRAAIDGAGLGQAGKARRHLAACGDRPRGRTGSRPATAWGRSTSR